jgi:hypothetical protein
MRNPVALVPDKKLAVSTSGKVVSFRCPNSTTAKPFRERLLTLALKAPTIMSAMPSLLKSPALLTAHPNIELPTGPLIFIPVVPQVVHTFTTTSSKVVAMECPKITYAIPVVPAPA